MKIIIGSRKSLLVILHQAGVCVCVRIIKRQKTRQVEVYKGGYTHNNDRFEVIDYGSLTCVVYCTLVSFMVRY